MPRPKRFPHRYELYLGDVENEIVKSTASLLGISPQELVRAALADNLEKARVNTGLWALELMEAAK